MNSKNIKNMRKQTDITDPTLEHLHQDFIDTAQDSSSSVTVLLHKLKKLTDKGGNPAETLSHLQLALGKCQIDLYTILISKTEEHFNESQLKISETTLSLAISTKDPSLAFIAGWVCLNENELDKCIQILETIDNPDAVTKAMLGQAYLEHGEIGQAIVQLEDSVEMEPNDCLHLFFLAKAYFAQNSLQSCVSVFEKCHKLNSQSDEITQLVCSVLTKTNNIPSSTRATCWNILIERFENSMMHKPNIVISAIEACFFQAEPKIFESMVGQVEWETLLKAHSFHRYLPSLLNKLNQPGWEKQKLFFLKVSTLTHSI